MLCATFLEPYELVISDVFIGRPVTSPQMSQGGSLQSFWLVAVHYPRMLPIGANPIIVPAHASLSIFLADAPAASTSVTSPLLWCSMIGRCKGSRPSAPLLLQGS